MSNMKENMDEILKKVEYEECGKLRAEITQGRNGFNRENLDLFSLDLVDEMQMTDSTLHRTKLFKQHIRFIFR